MHPYDEQFNCSVITMRPSKRSSLQSPNPVKHSMLDDPVDLVAPASTASTGHSQSLTALHPSVTVTEDTLIEPSDDEAECSTLPLRSDHENSHGSPRAASLLSVPVALSSPSSNRDRFLQGFTPARTCCNLDLCRAPAGSKFNLSAICIAVFPPSKNPDRRYVTLADCTGSVGVTVWNENVANFGSSSVGKVVALSKVVIISHHGKKQLSMARDSVVGIVVDDNHDVMTWWKSLLIPAPKSCGQVHDTTDGNIISVSGVCGRVSHEIKMVNGVERTITCLHVVDFSGKLDVKSWNHPPSMFQSYVDRPILIKRVKVSSFAGTKHCELLDGDASIFETTFVGMTELAKFWTS